MWTIPKIDTFIKTGNRAWEETLNSDQKQLLEQATQDDLWGFDKKNSGAPSPEKTTANRASPKGISYLYVSEDANTAISELRPIIGQSISVAEILIKKELRLFDFTATIQDIDGTLFQKSTILQVIARNMSKPNYGDEQDYLPTQYISEMLKEKFCFQGIRFKSSLTADGNNIVLFNTTSKTGGTKNYKILNSALYGVSKVEIDAKKLLPLKK